MKIQIKEINIRICTGALRNTQGIPMNLLFWKPQREPREEDFQ